MKRFFSLLLSLVIVLTLCACSGGNNDTGSNSEDYDGTWIRETWTNEKTGAVIDITLYLYDDYTYTEKTDSSTGEYTEMDGSWEVKDNQIVLSPSKLVAGKDVNFGEDGRLLEGISMQINLEIVDNTTLKNGIGILYNKEH